MTKTYDRAYFDRWYRAELAPGADPDLVVRNANARLGDQRRRLRFGQVHGWPLTGWFHEEAISSQDASIADTQGASRP